MSKVLVIEDNAVNRELLREMLEIGRHEVIEACDGPEALAILQKLSPDIILLDINMPVMDGYTVLRNIRENPTFSHVPVVAVTAYAMKGDREKILGAGFDSYLSKPVETPTLLQELRRLQVVQEEASQKTIG